ncbi:DUF2806 domain-containing protein [Pseudomonas syringae]|uniref:DUF2806 domain-containing protein n=1 Tax=Pseudomonas syringae TaxID=317 RepID=UPI001BCE6B25|nr:DUF2806 domain-containing protein [Pseudomonas syringae]QVI72201.1 DUF2806 domain-containing protein [Pseudomonas syringae]UZS69575.1 DUF2806 domain-containing protein [Pseudomonas syringae]
MAEGFSLVDLKGVSEPITKLIESVSKGIGALYEPVGKVRSAKAEARSKIILAEADIAVDSVRSRALERVTYQEVRRQTNIDDIVSGAVSFLPDKVSSQAVDEDWIVNFFNLGQDIGNAQMQKIWSRLLAGEVTKPGSFGSRTVQAVKSLSVEDANLFTTVCGFSFIADGGDRVLPLLSKFFDYVRANGLSAGEETHLKNIGLLHSSFIWYGVREPSRKVYLDYFSDMYCVKPSYSNEVRNIYTVDAIPFTQIGLELASIAGGKPNKKYIDHLVGSGDLFPSDE